MAWRGNWIWRQDEDNPRFSICYFRRSFEIDRAEGTGFVAHVTADSRYRLYVNGVPAGRGPARGDMEHYNFETYDLAHLLRDGRNVIAVQVLAYSTFGPVSEMHSNEGGLAFNGTITLHDGRTMLIDSDDLWRVLPDAAYSPQRHHGIGWYLVNPVEIVDGAKFPWGWTDVGYDDSHWQMARKMTVPFNRSNNGHPRQRWRLVPRAIPHLPETPVNVEQVRSGPMSDELRRLLDEGRPMTVGANESVELTFYMGKEFTGFPSLELSGGRGSTVRLYYAEALKRDGRKPLQRDDISAGDVPHDLWDTYLADGSDKQSWEPIHWRCARYMKLHIETADEPLTLSGMKFRFTSFPFRQQARFRSDDPQLSAIWDIAWHTALCCAHEHYEDCPYYEQLQYVGDTRLQALISYLVAGDDRLGRQALRHFDHSRLVDGIVQSRYPNNITQIIPPFSLYYLMMIEDHYLHNDDARLLRELEPSIHSVIRWFTGYIGDNGLLGRTPWWNFTDWCEQFPDGVPPEADGQGSTIINLQLVAALQSAARLMDAIGDGRHRDKYAALAEKIRQAVRQLCWNDTEGLFVDGPGSENLSQHSNMWAILTDAANSEQTRRILSRLTSDERLTKSTFYFDYYLYQALHKAGDRQGLEKVLEPWRQMVRMGFSTFPEKPEPTRSDCHAWSAWPMFELLRTVLGVRPTAPGWAAAEVAPCPLSTTNQAQGVVPTLRGPIAVAWQVERDKSGNDGELCRMGLRLQAPEGMPITVRLPDGTEKLFAAGGAIVFGDEKLIPASLPQ